MTTRYTLKIPETITMTTTESGVYMPDADGLVETTNEADVETLKRHGWTVVKEHVLAPVMGDNGVIDVEELGRGDLYQALARRGVELTVGLGRDELVRRAQAFNERLLSPPVPTEPVPEPATLTIAQPKPKKQPTLAEQIEELKRMAQGGDAKAAADLEAIGVPVADSFTYIPDKQGAEQSVAESPKLEKPAGHWPTDTAGIEAMAGTARGFFDLRGYLGHMGVGFPPTATKADLLKMALDVVGTPAPQG